MNQKVITTVSLSLVILGAVLVNEFVIKSAAADQDRQVASFGERFEPNQIKWEQELANEISKDSNAKTVLATKPNSRDKLLFEIFEGRYEAQMNQGKINKIALLPNQAPVEITTTDFMKEYAPEMKEFHTYEIANTINSTSTVNLKNSKGDVIGNLQINRDDKGRVLSIEVQ